MVDGIVDGMVLVSKVWYCWWQGWYGMLLYGMVWCGMTWYGMQRAMYVHGMWKHGMVGGTAGAAWHWQVGVRARQRTTVHFPRALLSHASLDRHHLQTISHNCCNVSQTGKDYSLPRVQRKGLDVAGVGSQGHGCACKGQPCIKCRGTAHPYLGYQTRNKHLICTWIESKRHQCHRRSYNHVTG